MALKINHNINYLGENLSFECYTVITQLLGDKERLQIKVENKRFDNQEIKIDEKLYWFVPSVEATSSNFIKQGYEYLKTLDEFKDAIDLLDEGQTT